MRCDNCWRELGRGTRFRQINRRLLVCHTCDKRHGRRLEQQGQIHPFYHRLVRRVGGRCMCCTVPNSGLGRGR